jgi:toxin YoeB
MNIQFLQPAFEEYRQWANDNFKVFAKLNSLITEILRDPFHGTGKPEPLKHEYSGYWSRHITREHRIIYGVSGDLITVISCKSHYK